MLAGKKNGEKGFMNLVGTTLLDQAPHPDLELVVVIPSYDEPDLEQCLNSLLACQNGQGIVEVLVIINYPESASEKVKSKSLQTYRDLLQKYRASSPARILIYPVLVPLPDRKAGVGLARKTGMDEAQRRFRQLERPNGIIVNLDADCMVAPNYLVSIQSFFKAHPQIWAAGVQFEHHLSPHLAEQQKRAIVEYELHLRYFISAQRWIGLPFAFQTVGSCMAVQCEPYQKMGGMNNRKAGEDFYFLHKYIDVNRFAEINDTTVFPSSRASSRVPFGTGRAIKASLDGVSQKTYSWDSFAQLEVLIETLPDLYRSSCQAWIANLPMVLGAFLGANDGLQKLEEIKRETSKYETFRCRFFQWFNAFRLMKYLHFARDYFPDRPVVLQASEFMSKIDPTYVYSAASGLLDKYRKRARRGH